ncbi:hypothetical protein Tco_1255342 [Tanacetum coccineum]
MANGWMIPGVSKRTFGFAFANLSDAPEIEVPVMLCGAVERINLWTRKEFTFEFISKVWDTLGSDFASAAVEWFFRKNKQAMVFKVDFAKAYDSIRKIPRTCSSVADWLRISSGSYAAGGIYHGRPLVHMLIGLIGSIPSD